MAIEFTTIRKIGRAALDISRDTGGSAILLARILSRLFTPKLDGPELRRCMYRMGHKYLSITRDRKSVV